MPFRVGIDIGGTFTDVAVLNEKTGAFITSKSSTTYDDFLEGILNCLSKIQLNRAETSMLVHGTTVVTNALVQRRLPKVAMITTKGYRDVLEIMRQNRPLWGLFDIQWNKPQPLIPRHLRFEIDERVDAKGNILKPLNLQEVRDLANKIKSLGVESVAVSLLFSYLNPKHELQVKEIFEHIEEIEISLSSEVNPQIREYERASTTAINAAAKPLAKRYFRHLDNGLSDAGFPSKLLVMKSSGGLISVRQAEEFPIYTIESGPAAGTIGSAYLGNMIGETSLIAIDMGGTTFKVSIVDNGSIGTRSEGEVEWGIPYRTPMIDVTEIGAGGGSIASIDRDGSLKVGPQSAGSEPGPVCYGRGGTEPTFTDACLLLGYLNPSHLLGGEMKIDRDRAEKAIRTRIANPLRLDVKEAAYGIVEVSNNRMLDSMRVSSVERGYDPRDFATIAYGGAGPLVANYLARELGSSRVIIPPHPGIFSAIGMLVADIRLDFMRSYRRQIKDAQTDEIQKIYAALEQDGINALKKDFNLRHKLIRSADMRYVGQNYDVNASFPMGPVSSKSLRLAEKNFMKQHERLYGHAKGNQIEFVNLRVTVIGFLGKPKPVKIRSASRGAVKPKSSRWVYFEGTEPTETEVYSREELGSGYKFYGPCIIEEVDSTTVVYPKQRGTIDEYGNMVVETR